VLTQQEQEEQQAVLQEIFAGPEQGIDAPVPRRASAVRIAALPRPAAWPWGLAAGAATPHVLLAFGLAMMVFSETCSEPTRSLFLGPASVALLGAGSLMTPVGMLCGLAGILLVCSHLNGWVMLVSILTLPLNLYVCLILCGIIPFAC
jgi:hypothetical protein